jgi:catechol 2,3-dioxygenase-like lactoylglutathione lyase family enzyme
MLTAVCVGASDLDAATTFYDGILTNLNMYRTAGNDVEVGYGTKGQSPTFWVIKPYDKKAASFGNGSQVMLKAKDQSAVIEFHKAALALGGRDEGQPGLRDYAEGYFGAYVRDLDGNKLHAFCVNDGSL